MNEIEQDDDEDAIIYNKSDYFDDEINSVEGVNWLQEATEQQLHDDEEDCDDNNENDNNDKDLSQQSHDQTTNEKKIHLDGQLSISAKDRDNTKQTMPLNAKLEENNQTI